MTDTDGMTAEDLRASAEQLRAVLEAIDSGELEATGRERAFIAGALVTLVVLPGASQQRPAVEAHPGKRR